MRPLNVLCHFDLAGGYAGSSPNKHTVHLTLCLLGEQLVACHCPRPLVLATLDVKVRGPLGHKSFEEVYDKVTVK